jgi:hypothetical protein
MVRPVMRGSDKGSGSLFSYVDLEQRSGVIIPCGPSGSWRTPLWLT